MRNRKPVFPVEKTYTLKELQQKLDEFSPESKPTAQGLINYLKQYENNR